MKHRQQGVELCLLAGAKLKEKRIFCTVKQKTNAGYFLVVIDNTVKCPIKLPGNNGGGMLKTNGLADHQGQHTLPGEPVADAIDQDGLLVTNVPGNGQQAALWIFKEVTFEARFLTNQV